MNTETNPNQANNKESTPQVGNNSTDSASANSIGDEPINILIVDDEPKNLTVLETVLHDPSYRLVRAESADQALLALVVEEFALLILDIRMPGMSGFELATIIKERRKTSRVPIIFLTAYYNEDQHVIEGYATGAVDYLHKPVNPAILRSKVAVFAELHRKSRECTAANRSLLAEVTQRRRAEEQLRELNDTLEKRVTERTEALQSSEHYLASLIDVTPGTVHVFDLEKRRYTFINRSIASVLGYSPEEIYGLGDKVLTALMHSDDLPRFESHLARIRTLADKEVADFEFRMRDHADVWHWFHSRDSIFARNKSGEVLQIIGTSMDVSKRRQAEDTLRNADRQKDEFLATLAHELRNPLAPIRTGLQLLRVAEDDTAIVEQTWTMMERQLGQMVRLVDDLMDVSRISRGKIELRKQKISLESVINSAVESSRPLIEEMGHELIIQMPSQPIFVEGDLTRLAQVFMNLLNNSAKYSDPGCRIQLLVDQQGSDVLISVVDNGIGIAVEQLPRIFEMFAQLNHSINKAQGGLGIGLSLVRRLVEMHGGRIEAQSAGLGQGSKFTVQLPIVVEAPKLPETDSGEMTPLRSSLRILIVDDNRDGADSLSMVLRIMGNETRTAYDGQEGVDAAREMQPDVALFDIGLPKMNGYEACRQIRKQTWGNQIILIAVTGWGQDGDRLRAHEAGFDHHMVKPVEPRLLLKMLAGLSVAART